MKDLVEQFLAYEVKRHRDRLQQGLESMREEIDGVLRELARGEDPGRPSGLANSLTDVFHRIGALAQLREFGKLRQAEAGAVAVPATMPVAVVPAVVEPVIYRVSLTGNGVDGCRQALHEAGGGLQAVILAMTLHVPIGEVERVVAILSAYHNSPRGSAGKRQAAKGVAQRLLKQHDIAMLATGCWPQRK